MVQRKQKNKNITKKKQKKNTTEFNTTDLFRAPSNYLYLGIAGMVATLLPTITMEMDFQPLISLMAQIAHVPQLTRGHGGKWENHQLKLTP